MNLPRYPKYKPSGVDWLGEVPEHWEVKRVQEIAQIINGFPFDSTYFDLNEGIPLVRIRDIYAGATEVLWNSTPVPAAEINDADILIGMDGDFNVAWWDGGSAMLNQRVCCLRCSDMATQRLLFFSLPEPLGIINDLTYFTTVKHLSSHSVAAIRVALPPLPEQRVIADFLDRETGRIDALVGKKRALIAKLKEKRAAIITHAVTRGLNPAAKLKDSGVEWLGMVPEGWEVPPFYTRYKIELGKMLDEARITGDHLVPYLRNVDVRWDTINFEALPEMDILPHEYERYTLRKGDLVVCEGGEVGRAAIFEGNADRIGFQKALHRLRPVNSEEVPRYTFYVLCAAAQLGVFVAEGNPNTIPHLTGEKLRRYRFPCPPLVEQRAIADHLDREAGKLDRLTASIEAAIERLHEYRAALITAAVTGKIDVRGTQAKEAA